MSYTFIFAFLGTLLVYLDFNDDIDVLEHGEFSVFTMRMARAGDDYSDI